MVFVKKSKKKATKKKSKGKKTQDRDWSHEGGTSFQGNLSSDEKSKSGYRRTQEKDEQIRRSRLKMLVKAKSNQFKKKMGSKISMQDVVPELMKNGNSAVQQPPNPKKIHHESRIPSQFSVLDRLDSKVKTALSNLTKSNFIKNLIDFDTNGASQSDHDKASSHSSANGILSNHEFEQKDISTSSNPQGSVGGEVQSDEEFQLRNTNNNNYDWFFSSDDSKTSHIEIKEENESWGKYASFQKYDVFGKLHPSVQINTMRCLGDIPGLHKMWRHRINEPLSLLEENILPFLLTYGDVFVDGRSHRNDSELLHPCLLHIAIHVVNARSKVIKHNQKLKEKRKSQILQQEGESDDVAQSRSKKNSGSSSVLDTADLEAVDGPLAVAIQDQGYTRARVLILCPFRGSALQCVQGLKSIYGENTSVSNEQKFLEEYGWEPDEEDSEGDESADGEAENTMKPGVNRSHTHRKPDKPEDWKALFHQNFDDDFKLGIQIEPGQGLGRGAEKGVHMKLYTDFRQSDIILASPLGLRLIMNQAKTAANSRDPSYKTSGGADYLSSIEVLLAYQTDVMYMQNWDHMEFVLQHINQLPSNHSQLDIDFSRVRPYFLDSRSHLHRQLLLVSAFNEPPIQAMFRKYGNSQAGSVRIRYNWNEGVLNRVICRVRQIFQRVPSEESVTTREESRFQYFLNHVLVPILRMGQSHTLIVAGSYLDYVRIRNELIRREADAAFVCEYSRDSEISRGRSRFYHGQKKILLYSGRAHFFRRFGIRGARHIIFYSLVPYAHFYPEIVNCLEYQSPPLKDSAPGDDEGIRQIDADSSCLVLYDGYDRLVMERVVGKVKANHIFSSKKNTFIFC